MNPKYVYDRLFLFFVSASDKHITWLRNKIYKLMGVKGSVQRRVTKTQAGINPLNRIKFSTKEAKKLLNWIYYKPDLPCLKRKYIIAEPFLTYSK